MNEPEYQMQVPDSYQAQVVPEPSLALQVYEQGHESPEVQNAATLSEQKLEEAWAGEQPQQQQQQVSVGETSEAGRAPEVFMEFQVFRYEALPELWKRVLREITSRSLKHLLQTHGRLVAAGVAIGKCALYDGREYDGGRV
jgi:hypothetical protein